MTTFNETALKALADPLNHRSKFVLAFLSQQPAATPKEAVQDGTNDFYQIHTGLKEKLFGSRKVFDDTIERLEGAALIQYHEKTGRAKWYTLTEGGKEMLDYLEKTGSK